MNAAACSIGTACRAPLAIGPLQLSGRAFLAPMSGVTDIGMRRVARRFGASLVVSEMVASDDFVRGKEESRIRAEGEGLFPHVVQIAGRDPHRIGEAARLAEASGANAIDINMGCPAKRVTGGLCGSALMRDLELATSIIRAAVAAVTVPVTLKTRLGWDRSCLNAPELARRAEAEGVALLTVHARTRQQFYQGEADWPAIREVKEAVAIPVVANGDCTTGVDAAAMLAASGSNAVMIGRSALGRPWFVGQIAHLLATGKLGPLPSREQRRDAALTHYRTLLALFGREQGLRHARKHLAAYAEWAARDGSPSGAALRLPLVTSDNSDEAEHLLFGIFEYEPVLEAA